MATGTQGIGAGKHVLVTGGNGFVASHILNDLVNRDYLVTSTVRSQEKAHAVYERHPSWRGRVFFQCVPELSRKGAFDEVFTNAVQPFDCIIHTASPLTFSPKDIERDLIEPAVQGTLGMFESTYRLGGATVKRFILLGSAVAVLNSYQDKSQPGRDYTEKDWNPVTRSYAVENNDPVAGYNVSKTESEKAAWNFMHEHNPTFDLVVINPDIIIGPMIHPLSGPESVNATNQFAIKSFLDGTHQTLEGVEFAFYHFVDVRDVARAHVDSLTNPAASNKRILMITGLISPQLVVNIIRKNFPQLRNQVPEGDKDQIFPPGTHPTGWDTHESVNVLSEGTSSPPWKYISLEKSIVDTVQCMLDAKLLKIN